MRIPIFLKQRRGSIMLLSTIILGAILLSASIAGFEALFYERRVTMIREQSEQAFALATGCMEHALQKLGQTPTYQGNETYLIDGHTCTIWPIEVSGTWIIKTRVTIGQQTARLRVSVSSRTPITISSWQEGVVF